MNDEIENGAGVLNLDALYGVERPLKVLWAEREYLLRRPQAMGPREVVALQQLQVQAAGLQTLDAAHMTDGQATQLVEVAGKLLALICPELANIPIPFVAQGKIITWYFNEVAMKKKVTGLTMAEMTATAS